MDARILILGCGKMGGAILSGWLSSGWEKDQICVVETFAPVRSAWQEKGVSAVASVAEIPAAFIPSVVLVAVKPQSIDTVLPALASLISDRCSAAKPMVISILAGATVATYENALGKDTPILRVMPNTPAAVGRGVSGLFANSSMTSDHRVLGGKLLGAVGAVSWVDDEDLMHAVTAVSGSGPAYVFHLVEAMAKAGEKLGLGPEIAMDLARQTVIGSAELMRQSDEDAAQLRINVTSPGGTTAEALAVMMRDGSSLTDMMVEALAANAQRSRELS